jgi:hypothetical protein
MGTSQEFGHYFLISPGSWNFVLALPYKQGLFFTLTFIP